MHTKIKGKIMNENNMLLIAVLLSFLLAIPVAYTEVFVQKNTSEVPLMQLPPSEEVKKPLAANEETLTQKERINTESIKQENTEAKKNDRFIPTEAISEDLSVSFPTDI